MNIFIQFDFISEKPQLTFDQRTRVNTIVGSILSLAVMAVTTFIFINSFKKSQFTVYKEAIHSEEIFNLISEENFGIAVGIISELKESETNKLFNIRLDYIARIDEGSFIETNIPIEKCNQVNQVNNLFREIPNSIYQNLYCIDFKKANTITLRNDNNQNSSSFLNLKFSFCPSLNCQISRNFNNSLFQIHFYTFGYSLIHSDKENPIQKYIHNEIKLFSFSYDENNSKTKINSQFTKNNIIYYNNIIYNTANMLFTQDAQTDKKEVISFSHIKNGEIPPALFQSSLIKIESNANDIAQYTIALEQNNTQNFVREYKSIINIFAEIGGLVKILLIISRIITMLFSRAKLYEKIIKECTFPYIKNLNKNEAVLISTSNKPLNHIFREEKEKNLFMMQEQAIKMRKISLHPQREIANLESFNSVVYNNESLHKVIFAEKFKKYLGNLTLCIFTYTEYLKIIIVKICFNCKRNPNLQKFKKFKCERLSLLSKIINKEFKNLDAIKLIKIQKEFKVIKKIIFEKKEYLDIFKYMSQFAIFNSKLKSFMNPSSINIPQDLNNENPKNQKFKSEYISHLLNNFIALNSPRNTTTIRKKENKMFKRLIDLFEQENINKSNSSSFIPLGNTKNLRNLKVKFEEISEEVVNNHVSSFKILNDKKIEKDNKISRKVSSSDDSPDDENLDKGKDDVIDNKVIKNIPQKRKILNINELNFAKEQINSGAFE